MASLIVQKYGGTSVGSIDHIKRVAQRIAETRRSGKDVVAVVSAMAGKTDQLLKMAWEISDTPKQRELDLLLSSGERISSALLTIALNAIGCPAVSLTGRQIGLQTDNKHTRARIKQIDGERCQRYLQKNHVVVVAGFQGVNEHGDVTTLGRGGSDTHRRPRRTCWLTRATSRAALGSQRRSRSLSRSASAWRSESTTGSTRSRA